MPRKTRMYVPGIPAHIVQRGNNRTATFFCDDDYQFYKIVLEEGLCRYGGELHAYCLMSNHVHLLITPRESDSISRIMQHVGRQYVRYINQSYKRSGTLWEGRHKSSLIDADTYLLSTYRYIELNPVTAGMTSSPEDYRWSSYRANAWGEADKLVTAHPLYLELAGSDDSRLRAYRELFATALSKTDVHTIRQTLNACYPLGNDRFKQQVEAVINRKLGALTRGGKPAV